MTHPRRTVVDVTDHQPTRLVLVRHGESVATVDRFIGGVRTCTGLSDLGRQQTGACPPSPKCSLKWPTCTHVMQYPLVLYEAGKFGWSVQV